ncbi:GMC family oxidoreductase [Lentibacillus salinarum]|uniref:GMC family oxidoreductase n=1 Tax=Lentibacillus salinarum TaxID=446820 RepID=A0ABW3ZU60_9BACI
MVKKMDKVDVVTVGVGWTGGIIAAELTKAGYKVVGLEKGHDRTINDYLYDRNELKYSSRGEMMQDLNNNTITYRNNLDQKAKPVRNKDSLVLGTSVGGGGSHWAAQTHRYFGYDFEIRNKMIEKYGEDKIPKGMILKDWGITYDELEPYYDRMEKTMGVSGEEDPLAEERSDSYPTSPNKLPPSMKLFRESAENLGYHPFVRPTGIASEQYENPDGQTIEACQYCAFCSNFGCDWGAKADPIITVIPTAQETGNFELRTHSEVKRVLYEGDKATGVLYADTRTGQEYEQPADVVVLTSFVFNNVRLLLLSEIGEPYNPKNGKGIIGKHFTDHHFEPITRGFFDDKKFNNYIGSGGLGVCFTDYGADHFDHSDVNFLHGGQIEIQIGGNGPISNNPVPEGTPTWGEEFKKQSLKYYNRYLDVSFKMATLPYEDHYMDLDPTYKDDAGDPLIRCTYDFTDDYHARSEFLQNKCYEVLEEMGADIIEKHKLPDHFDGSFLFQHNGGGAVMGDSPENSAVNNYSQMWEMDNLFVCGASAFPHFGITNPTLTVGALTYRASEGIIDYLDNEGGLLVSSNKEKQTNEV